MVLPGGFEGSEEASTSFAAFGSGSTLVNGRVVGVGEDICVQGTSNVLTDRSGQPMGLEIGNLLVQVVTLLLEDNLICGAVELFERKSGSILGMDFAESMRQS